MTDGTSGDRQDLADETARALLRAWPAEAEFEAEALRRHYLPAELVRPRPLTQPQLFAPTPVLWQAPRPSPPRDPWPARLAGGGVLCAGLGVGAYFFGLGVHAAGTGLWAVAAVLLGAGFLRHGLGGGSGRVNIRIDNRNSR